MPRQLQLEFYRHDPDHPGSLSPNAVNAMYSAPDGTLYAGTVEGGLNCLMPHSDHLSIIQQPIPVCRTTVYLLSLPTPREISGLVHGDQVWLS